MPNAHNSFDPTNHKKAGITFLAVPSCPSLLLPPRSLPSRRRTMTSQRELRSERSRPELPLRPIEPMRVCVPAQLRLAMKTTMSASLPQATESSPSALRQAHLHRWKRSSLPPNKIKTPSTDHRWRRECADSLRPPSASAQDSQLSKTLSLVSRTMKRRWSVAHRWLL